MDMEEVQRCRELMIMSTLPHHMIDSGQPQPWPFLEPPVTGLTENHFSITSTFTRTILVMYLSDQRYAVWAEALVLRLNSVIMKVTGH
jgi:hypothetical protein